MGAGFIHQSVLLRETIEGLNPQDGGIYVDVTCGLGGHAEALLKACAPTGKLLAVDRDPTAIELATGRLHDFEDRLTIVEGNFSDVSDYCLASDHYPVDGVVADLGVSSMQLDDGDRGFSFMKPGPLDMRMGPKVGATAAELLESFSEADLTKILKDFGEIRHARRISSAIIKARDAHKLSTTADLAQVIEDASGGRKGSPIHPATRAFQAIRMAVNRELDELEDLLKVLEKLVRPGGRVAIISFHSLEDRVVKRAFEDPAPEELPRGLPIEPKKVYGPWKALTKKPIIPSEEEIKHNARSRSAKLRIAERRHNEGEPRP